MAASSSCGIFDVSAASEVAASTALVASPRAFVRRWLNASGSTPASRSRAVISSIDEEPPEPDGESW
jgi:hypothetical protein